MNASVTPLHWKNDNFLPVLESLFARNQMVFFFFQKGYKDYVLNESLVLCRILEDLLQQF